MKDRRQFERFSLTLPARMEAVVSNRKQIFKLKTKDISAAGAFVNTTEIFSNGTQFKMDFTIPSNKIKELTGVFSLIECEGSIVRSTPKGMAICFNKECQILSLIDL
jgi:c-di-GMP-binding flagellar brake protein YcgR